jgi:hypothetical protein
MSPTAMDSERLFQRYGLFIGLDLSPFRYLLCLRL